MADSKHALLEEAWNSGRTGNFSASSQAKLWGIREAWRHTKKTDHARSLELNPSPLIESFTWKILEALSPKNPPIKTDNDFHARKWRSKKYLRNA